MEFGELKKVQLREIWPNESADFTPWLASNIEALGNALGLELELIDKEASVGDFSLDLLARDLGTSKIVVIENQISQTDHDHLGKLLTYAAGFNASIVIWVSGHIRDEHRQALEWLNQRTDTDTQFFGVVIEILKIDDSRPAFNFKPVVFPNEWQKSRKNKTSSNISLRSEKYRAYFKELINNLREKYHFTSAQSAQPRNFYSFSSGIPGILLTASFVQGGKARTEVYIDTGDYEKNKFIFDKLKEKSNYFTEKFDSNLEWERIDEKRGSRIAIYRTGSIELSDSELEDIRKWHIDNLLKMKEIFVPAIKEIINKT